MKMPPGPLAGLTLAFFVSQLCLLSAQQGDPGPASGESSFRLFIRDPLARAFVYRALQSASERLARPRCQTIFSEFRDRHGRPLTETLAQFGRTPQSYLRLIIFVDQTGTRHCVDSTLALTVPGSRVVYLCARHFVTSWRHNAPYAEAALIHEMLHTLGLGENPPPSADITQRILTLCGSA